MRRIACLALVVLACSDTDDGTGDSGIAEVGSGGGIAPVGAECMANGDCRSNVCWDFADYDSLCGGTVCSDVCETDADCVAVAQAAGAEQPDDAQCGMDGRCDLVGTGLGSFACA